MPILLMIATLAAPITRIERLPVPAQGSAW